MAKAERKIRQTMVRIGGEMGDGTRVSVMSKCIHSTHFFKHLIPTEERGFLASSLLLLFCFSSNTRLFVVEHALLDAFDSKNRW